MLVVRGSQDVDICLNEIKDQPPVLKSHLVPHGASSFFLLCCFMLQMSHRIHSSSKTADSQELQTEQKLLSPPNCFGDD